MGQHLIGPDPDKSPILLDPDKSPTIKNFINYGLYLFVKIEFTHFHLCYNYVRLEFLHFYLC